MLNCPAASPHPLMNRKKTVSNFNDTAIFEPTVLVGLMMMSFIIPNTVVGLLVCAVASVLLIYGPLGRIAFRVSIVYRVWSIFAVSFFVVLSFARMLFYKNYSDFKLITVSAFVVVCLFLYVAWWGNIRGVLYSHLNKCDKG